MPGRYEFERAIRRSELPPPSRHVALSLATWADADTGIIPERFQPSLSTLIQATGLSKASILTHLNKLENEGWIARDSPSRHDARTKHAITQYGLALPARSGADHAPEGARSGADLELGQELTKARSGADPELGQELTTRVPESLKSHQSPQVAGEPSRSRRQSGASGRTGSDRKSQTTNGQLPLLLAVQAPPDSPHHAAPGYARLAAAMTDHYGSEITVRHAAAVAATVLEGRPEPRDLVAYVMAAVRRDPARHRPVSLPATFRSLRAAGEA